MAFPSSPSLGDQHTVGARTWEFTGAGWRSVTVTNENQLAWTGIGPAILLDADIDLLAAIPEWLPVNYV